MNENDPKVPLESEHLMLGLTREEPYALAAMISHTDYMSLHMYGVAMRRYRSASRSFRSFRFFHFLRLIYQARRAAKVSEYLELESKQFLADWSQKTGVSITTPPDMPRNRQRMKEAYEKMRSDKAQPSAGGNAAPPRASA